MHMVQQYNHFNAMYELDDFKPDARDNKDSEKYQKSLKSVRSYIKEFQMDD